jgi:hypothetical protein
MSFLQSVGRTSESGGMYVRGGVWASARGQRDRGGGGGKSHVWIDDDCVCGVSVAGGMCSRCIHKHLLALPRHVCNRGWRRTRTNVRTGLRVVCVCTRGMCV